MYLCAKLSALNEDSSDEESENEEEEEVTREALEEIAVQQYGKTLELQKKGNLKDALKLLKELLDTELLFEVKKEEGKDASPLLKLKYLCYKNVASISVQLNDMDAAVDAYLEASYLDDTDITLWYKLGKTALDLHKYELAQFAFQRGIECNPKHWPCLDHLITLLLGLGAYNDCIITIYEALQLDNDYLRGKAYRKYIFTDYPHVKNYLSMLNPLYNWTAAEDEDVEVEECKKLIKEATDINEIFIKQVQETCVPKKLPVLTLNKPIENLTWLSVGESLVDMHMHISEKALSHACIVNVSQPEEKLSSGEEVNNTVEPMDVDVPSNKQLSADISETKTEGDTKQADERINENDSDKMDTDQDINLEGSKSTIELKDSKKSSRRRGSSVRFLQQWEWCNKRKSSRKKSNKPEQQETLFEILKRLLPGHLKSEESAREQGSKAKEFKGDDSMDTMDLYKLFEEKERNVAESSSSGGVKEENDSLYFNTEKEQTDVQVFIQKYLDSTYDIITMLDDFVLRLSNLWDTPWPEGLSDVYMEANWSSRQHSDPPLSYVLEENVLKNYIKINILHLEVGINKLLEEDSSNGNIEMELIDLLRMFCSRSAEIGDEALSLTLRYLWVKCHSLLYKNEVEFALDCLYYIIDKLSNLDDEGNAFVLKVVNFTKWPVIAKSNCIDLIKALERNKLLSTVPRLFDLGKYEEVISILEDSFKNCQMLASKQDWKAMSLDWGVQLVTLLESIWATSDTEQCFIWGTVCLNEAFKQYMLCDQGTEDCEKWSLVVIKSLVCIEHILNSEGSGYLDVLPEKNLIHMIQDIIQIIVHQLDEANNLQEMPINSVVCWILLHYVFQREEDRGRMPKRELAPDAPDTEMPVSIMVLFMGHEKLGSKGWCINNDSKLLYFTLRTVLARLRSPALSGVVEIMSQYLQQCVLCLFGHPSKKLKLRYLVEHNVPSSKLDWEWSQLIFDLFRPEELPEFNSYRLASITGETEQLFQNMLSLAPAGADPQPHYSDVISFIEGRKNKLPHVQIELPFKMRDIFYLLADFYLKNNETVKALKYYAYDIVICRKRFDSWAGMALARGSLLETKLNSCESFRNEMEYLNRATAVEFCFKQALEIDSSHSMLWIEYGSFVYGVHSFCSRMLKQASESLSMEDFEVLENRKDSMLDTASKCFIKAHRQWMEECQGDDKSPQDERWLHYYMLGKISEKKNEQPQKYLDYYIKAATFLQENNATYPTKINYSNPQNLSVEALEIQYRIHASILKYIEQHENKAICTKDGKYFKDCLDKCTSGPFSRKKITKETSENKEQNDSDKNSETNTVEGVVKRPNSDVADPVEGNEAKKLKTVEEKPKETNEEEKSNKEDGVANIDKPETTGEVNGAVEQEGTSKEEEADNKDADQKIITQTISENTEAVKENTEQSIDRKKSISDDSNKETKEGDNSNTATSKENSSSETSSDSSSSDSSSSTSSSSSSDSNDKLPAEMSQEEIKNVISVCLNSLEDCVSRFPQHYKALYRLAHFHFYYKKERNIDRCKELMLGTFVSNNGTKLQGLFCERKISNFFNSIWRIPASEVDRPGSFATHMSRCILITMEVLKELDDHKTLLDLSLQLQKTPEADKKYLRESERIELFQQALSLCTRSIKGHLSKFHKVDDLSSTTPEKQQVANFMLDLYRTYQKTQKSLPSKAQVFGGLLTDCYKIYSGKLDSENLLDKCIKKCQSIMVAKRQQAQQAAQPAPPPVSKVEATTSTAPTVVTKASTPEVVAPVAAPPPPKKPKPAVPIIPASSFLPHVDSPMVYPTTANPFLQYMSMMDRNLLSSLSSYDQATAALYLSNMSSLTGIPPAAFTPDLIRQMLSLDPFAHATNSLYNQSTSSKMTSQSKSSSNQSKTSSTQSNKSKVSSTVKSGQAQITHAGSSQSNLGRQINVSTPNPLSVPNTSSSIKQTSANLSGSGKPSASNTTKPSHVSPSHNPKQSHQSSSNNTKQNYQTSNNSVKQSHQSSNSNSKQSHQSSTNNDELPYQTPSQTNNPKSSHQISTSSVIKPTHQTLPVSKSASKMTTQSQQQYSTSGKVKESHQTFNPSNANKSSHQSSGGSGKHSQTSGSGNKMPHQYSTSSLQSQGGSKPSYHSPSPVAKSTHQTSSSSKSTYQSSNLSTKSTPSPNAGNSKSSYQSSSNIKPPYQPVNTSNVTMHSKPSSSPQMQISPTKTLQEKLAEKKQNPSVLKSTSEHSSNRLSQSPTFTPKLPASLTITKTTSSSRSSPNTTSSNSQRPNTFNTNAPRPSKDVRYVPQQTERLAQPKKVIDTSEVIVLDDD